jgi:hypothetical protein
MGAKADWVVVIPSYNRVDTLKAKTLKVLQDHKIPASKIYVFVANEEQKKLYEEGLEKGSVGHIVVGVKGLPEVRNFIFDYFPKGKHLVSFDDDVRGFLEFDESAKRHEKKIGNLAKMFDRGFEECKKAGGRFWGVYPSANGFFMKDTVTTDLKFIIGSFWGCFNPKDDVRITIGNGEKEDYQRTIQFWELDKVVVRLNMYAVQTATYATPGGLQEGNRLEREKKTVEAMIKKWPQYIKMNPRRKSGYPEIRLVQPKEDGETLKKKTRKVKKTKPSE